MALVIAASTNKGGVGKTSLTTNLAAAISSLQPDKRVLIVDMDSQGNSALAFGRKPGEFTETIMDVLTGEKHLDEVMVELADNLYLTPANKDFRTIDFEILLNPNKYPQPLNLLKPEIDRIRGKFDYIFIDSPPSLSLVAGNILSSADRIIVPFEPELFAVQGLITVIEEIEMFKDINPSLQLAGIIGMRVDTRTTLHTEMLQQARRFCQENGYTLFDTVIPRSIRFASAAAYEGKPAVWTDKANPIVGAYFELLEEVLEHVGQAEAH